MTPDDHAQIAYAGYAANLRVQGLTPLPFARWQGRRQHIWEATAAAINAKARELDAARRPVANVVKLAPPPDADARTLVRDAARRTSKPEVLALLDDLERRATRNGLRAAEDEPPRPTRPVRPVPWGNRRPYQDEMNAD